jgi:basic amino acid/polyamine antiporter, APA family
MAELKKTLSRFNLVNLGIGGIIGAGIFVITGQAAAQYAGPGIIFSFIIAAIVCFLSALCYAELASMIPVGGSAYTYARATMGNFFAWIIGWDLILEYLFCVSTVAVGWSGYAVSFLQDFGVRIPTIFASSPLLYDATGWHRTGAVLNLPAIAIVTFLTFVLILGIKESAKFNNVIVCLKVSVILAFIAFGISYINPMNWFPLIPANTGEFGHFGISGIFRGASVIFFAYIGFDAVSTAASEAKDPQKDMAFGILGSLAISTVLYLAVALVLTGMTHFTTLNVPDPIAVAVNSAGTGLAWLRPIIKIGALAGLSSVCLVMMIGQTRIFYTMAKDGLMPPIFSRLHPKFHTPYFPTLLTGAVAALICGFLPIGILGELVSIGTLFAFFMVSISVLILRKTRPDMPRPFKTPWVPFIPILSALAALVQMLVLPGDTWLRLIIWMGLGIAVYAFYGRKHAKVVDTV